MTKNKDNFENEQDENARENDLNSVEMQRGGGIIPFLRDRIGFGYIGFGALLLLLVVVGGRHKIASLFSSGTDLKAPIVTPAKPIQPVKPDAPDAVTAPDSTASTAANSTEVASTQPVASTQAATSTQPSASAQPSTSTQPTAAAMNTDAVKDAVKDFILNNPDVIVASLTKYQQKINDQRAQASKDYMAKNIDKLNAGKPYLGNAKGDLVITEFFDYKCGYCKKVHPDLMRLVKEYPNLKISLIELPFFGPASSKAVKFSLAVNALYPEKFSDFHAGLMNAASLDDEAIFALIAQNGMDKAKLVEKANSDEIDAMIKENVQQATNGGVQGVPSFVIGGDFISGSTYDDLKKKIDAINTKKAN